MSVEEATRFMGSVQELALLLIPGVVLSDPALPQIYIHLVLLPVTKFKPSVLNGSTVYFPLPGLPFYLQTRGLSRSVLKSLFWVQIDDWGEHPLCQGKEVVVGS